MTEIVKPSKAAIALDTVTSTLNDTTILLNRIQPPVIQVVVVIQQLDGYLIDAEKGLKLVDNVLLVLREAMQISKYLADLIPEVGPVLANAIVAIEKLNIEGQVRKIAKEISDIIKKARDGAVKNIKEVANRVSSRLTQAADALPHWRDTVNLLSGMFKLVDLTIYVVLGTTTDQAVAEALASLHKIAEDVLSGLHAVTGALDPIRHFVEETWKTFKDAVLEPIQKGFSALMETLQPVLDVVNKCLSVCGTIKEWFQPFFWLLEKINWLFEHTVGWLIDKVMGVLKIKDFMDNVVNRIKDALGITKLREDLERMFGAALEPCVNELNAIVQASGAASIVGSVQDLATLLMRLRQDPYGQMFFVLEKCLSSNPIKCEPGKLCDWYDPKVNVRDMFTKANSKSAVASQSVVAAESFKLSAREALEEGKLADDDETEAADDETEEADDSRSLVRVVRRQQADMDALVASAGPQILWTPSSGLAASNSRTALLPSTPGAADEDPALLYSDPTAPPSAEDELPPGPPIPPMPVKMDYGIYDGMPVSILLRVQHPQALKPHPNPNRQLVPLSEMQPSDPTITLMAAGPGNEPLPSFSSGGRCPSYDLYCAKLTELENEITLAVAYLGRMQAAADQADSDFARYTSGAAAFCGHFESMLQGLDPILTVIKDLLLLPNKYRTVLTTDLADYVPQSFINPIFSVIDQLTGAVDRLHQRMSDTQTQTTDLSKAYTSFHDHVAQVCSAERFSTVSKPLGNGVTGLGSMVKALQARLDSTSKTFTNFRVLGKNFIERTDATTKPNDGTDPLKDLDGAFAGIVSLLETTLAEVRGIPPKLDAVYNSLSAVHSDVQLFFIAADTVSQRCRDVEGKVVAADTIRIKCARIHNIISPFESILSQYGVKPDLTNVLKDNIKHAEEHQDMTLSSVFTEILPDIAFIGLDLFLVRYFDLSAITTQLKVLTATLSPNPESLEAHLNTYNTSLTELMTSVSHMRDETESAAKGAKLQEAITSLLSKTPNPTT